MARTGENVHVRKPQIGRLVADGVDRGRAKMNRGGLADLRDHHLTATGVGAANRFDLGRQAINGLLYRVAEIDGEKYPAWHSIRRAW